MPNSETNTKRTLVVGAVELGLYAGFLWLMCNPEKATEIKEIVTDRMNEAREWLNAMGGMLRTIREIRSLKETG